MYYNGNKLLSLKDLNKNKPEIYISTSNRSAGKTTFFGKYLIDNFLKNGEKFCLIYRYSYELHDVANKFFSDLSRLFYPHLIMSQTTGEKDTFIRLNIGNIDMDDCVNCGYAVALNKADNIKKLSHLLSDVNVMLFDEFQPESNQYCTNEIYKFQSIHTSLARGGGKQVKYLPVIMISNFVSLLNPYYNALHITERLNIDTNYLRGTGWVLEQGFNDSASNAQKESLFNQAFNSEYSKFSSEKFYLNDSEIFVEKMKGKSQYIGSLKYCGEWYGIRYFTDELKVYIDNKPDLSYPKKYALNVDDMENDTILVNRTDAFVFNLRNYFDNARIRFKNLKCKGAFFALISY